MTGTRVLRATPDDLYPTATSIEQARTESSIAALLTDDATTTELRRDEHVAYLRRLLAPLPAPYVTFESNRAWLIYWVAHALDLLDAPLTGSLQARAISTLLHFQAPQGGFGGGPAQLGHLMSTYAAVCALAIVGGPGPAPTAADVAAGVSVEVGRGGWDAIDRYVMPTHAAVRCMRGCYASSSQTARSSCTSKARLTCVLRTASWSLPRC